jgi:hypothetical protein
MDSKKPLYKSISFWVIVLLFLYSALGFLAVPYYIKKQVQQLSASEFNSKLTLENLSFNPFSFSSTIENLKLTDNDSQVWFSADKIIINLGLIKTLFGNTNISEVSLNNPNYYLFLEKQNNTAQIKYPKIKVNEAKQDTSFDLDIGNININQGSLNYHDESSDKTVKLTFKTIGFKHIDFTTDDANSQFDLSLITDNNDETEISGEFNFARLKSSGKWKLNQFSTETAFNFISDIDHQFYGFKNQSGIINANGEFVFDLNNEGLTDIIISSFTLSDFMTQTSKENQPSISVKQLELNDSQIDLAQKKILINSIDLQDSVIATYFLENNTLQWDYLKQQSIQGVEQNIQEDTWQYQIDTIKSNNLIIKLNKLNSNNYLENTLLLDTAEITNLSSEAQQKAELKLSIIPDNEGVVNLQASAYMDPLVIDSEISAQEINLISSQAWLPNDIYMTIKQGTLSLNQNFKWSNDHYKSVGWINVTNLNLLDQDNQTFFKVNELKLSDNNIDSFSKTITLNNILLDKAEGNLSISTDNQLNINKIIAEPEDKQKIKSKIKNTKDDWIININDVQLIDLQTNFIDHSIKPNYQSTLSKVNGSIKGLSSTNTSKADLDIKGVLDTYGQFDIKGQINPLSEKAYTDLAITILNLDLQNFSSYSNKFTGFPISRGKADFELNYKLNQSLLKGLNNLKFKQFQLGDKTPSEDAINLPLKLAIALLTDGNGIMSINLPVSGRVDDPEFSYGGLVFKAFFKLITGIVASPFKLLGKLIPNGADLDMSGIQFQAGTALLKSGEEEKLKAMQSILAKRPSLILELSSTINTIEDNKALKQKLLLTEIKLPVRPDFTVVDSLTSLEKTYSKLISSQKWQELKLNATNETLLNHAQLAENAWQELLDYYSEEAESQITLIAKQRSQEIQQLLIETYGIEEKRVFLKATERSETLIPQVKFGIAN